jgi:TPP-dependent pyruvate/acetoin dehydrogenase alpha subunit
MPLSYEKEKEIFRKASLSRAFEQEAFRRVQDKTIKIPVYLSAGQEYTAATLATYLESIDKQIFIQHRGHSTYLSFGGNIEELVYELLGDTRGCANGMGGSASIQSREKQIYGHDGLMGSHVPISTGMCYGNKKLTLCFTGDAAGEEDYSLTAIGWASTKNLPIWYIVEDNNLSILTEKKVRRNWELQDVAKSMNVSAFGLPDDPLMIWNFIESHNMEKPMLLNVTTNRLFWHAGAGIDDPHTFDRHKIYIDKFGTDIVKEAEQRVKEAWSKCLSH